MGMRLVCVVAVLVGVSVARGAAGAGGDSPVKVVGLRAEQDAGAGNAVMEKGAGGGNDMNVRGVLGSGFASPRLSWRLDSEGAGERQSAYEICAGAELVAPKSVADADRPMVSSPFVFDTGKVASDQSVLVAWPGKALASRERVYWQVRVWDREGKASAWSEPAYVEAGLLKGREEFGGEWITADLPRVDMEQQALAKAQWITGGSTAAQAAVVRTKIELPANAVVQSAVFDAAADGLIALYVNGKAIRQGSSSHTAPFHADFDAELVAGKNAIAISSLAVRNAGRGRGAGAGGGAGKNAIAAHGVITLASGQRVEFVTDGSWKAAVPPTSPPTGTWSDADFDDSSWEKAKEVGAYEAQPPIASADGTLGPGRYLRKGFTVRGPVAKARLYATALGVYEARINGKPVSDELFSPGWTDYTKRVMVQTYDVTGLLVPGQNVVGAILADGWFAGRVGWMGLAQYAAVSTRPLFAGQLEITYADGSMEKIVTDGSWKGGPGEIMGSDLQLGEVVDHRKAGGGKAGGWDTPGFNDGGWAAAVVETHENITLDPQIGPPVRKLAELSPQKITRRGDTWLVDFGQNMVGHVRIEAQGAAGTMIQVMHGEMLTPSGGLYNENLRQAISLDRFILRGGETEIFEPRFTFHGFRYAEITGYPGELTPEKIRAIVVGSDTPAAGTFECSNADVNRLYQNIVWGQRGNFLSVPTDCPQRDERMGWMGDAQVFAPTAARIADVAGFFQKWMIDVNDAQGPRGEFSTVSPRANQNNSWPVWGDAGVIIPWEMYLAYGDKAFLDRNYEHMARWVDYNARSSQNFLLSGGVGDHLAPVG